MKRQKKKYYCPYCGSRVERYHSPETVAMIFDCSVDNIRKMVQNHKIGYRKIGRLVRIPSSELEKVGTYIPSVESYLS